MSEDWNHMLDFADELLRHAETHRQNNSGLPEYVSKRISFIHFDHALELFMKAYLIKEGYVISKLDTKKIQSGVKEDESISKILKKDRTLDFSELLNLFSKISGLSGKEKREINDFHKYRNEIQHRSLRIDIDKGEKLKNFQPVIRSVYEKVFTDRRYPLGPNTN